MSDLDLIKSRVAEIEAELAEMDSRRAALADERGELGVAQRVLERLALRAAHGSPAQFVVNFDPAGLSAEESGKPSGKPTVPEMILTVLAGVKRRGLRGLEPKQMRPLIANQWWPDIPSETVNSIAWRMWKRGQLAKDGAIYMLPGEQEQEEAVERETASS